MVSRLVDRGSELLRIVPTSLQHNRDGDEVRFPDESLAYEVKVTAAEDRQSDAELAGQVTNKVLRLTCRDAPGLDSWAELWFRGEQWDLASPPHFSKGPTRWSSHVELMIRSRNGLPSDDESTR